MFRATRPTKGQKSGSKPKSKAKQYPGSVQINRLRHELSATRRRQETKTNTDFHIKALERNNANAWEAKKTQPLSKYQSEKLEEKQQQLNQERAELEAAPIGTTVQQQAKKVGGFDTRPHIRSIWYMTPVDGISDIPTATGRVPHEYQNTKFFIPDPALNEHLQGLAEHPKVRIKTTAFSHLNRDEQKRALKALDLPHPDTIHKDEPYPHLHYFTAPLLKDKSPVKLLKLSGGETRAFRTPQLAVTAFSINQVPRLRHHTRDVEIVFVGRSNVGKSSLINSLTHSDLAKTGRTPGKTQSLNFYALHPEALRGHRASAAALARASSIDTDRIYKFVSKLDPALTLPLTQTQESTINSCYKRAGNGPVMMLVDVPGYGHANAPDWIVDKWNVMLGSYLRLRSPLNFPIDEKSKWTTKEYVEELDKLKKNRLQPRRKTSVLDRSKAPKRSTRRPTGQLWDQSDDDEASDAWESDYEQDPLKLFEEALASHVDQMKYHLERRVADYQTLMGKFNELEELEKALEEQELKMLRGEKVDKELLYDPVVIQERRLELIKLHADLRAQIDNEDPLNATATNIPGEWDDEAHLKLRQERKTVITDPAMNRYKRLLASKTNQDSNQIDSTATPDQVIDVGVGGGDGEKVVPVVKKALRIKPRVLNRAMQAQSVPETSPDETNTNTSKTENNSEPVDEVTQVQDEIKEVLAEPVAGLPVAPRTMRQIAKRPGGRQHSPAMLKEAEKEHGEDVDPYDLMKTFRGLQLLETQLNTHTQNRFQPLHTRLPPLEHLGQLHGSPLKNVVVLLDARAGVTKYDLQFLNFLEKFHITHQVVLTKIDRLSTSELEGAAYSTAQALFPHEFVKMLQKTQPLQLSAFPEGKLPTNSPTFTIKSSEQDKLWEASLRMAPRKYCSPMLIGVSSEKRMNIDVLQRVLMHGILERI